MSKKGLELNDDISFQRKEWLVERSTWTVLGLMLVAAVLGLFGTAPISRAAAESDGLTVAYERFTRKLAFTDLEIRLAEARTDSFTVYLSDSWASNVDIEQITPEPDTATRTDGGLALTFSRVPDAPAVVTIQYRPNKIGVLSSTVGTGRDGSVVYLSQFIYP